MRRFVFVSVALLAVGLPAFSHPAPFSYLDLRIQAEGLDGALVAHVIDFAHDLQLARPDELLVPSAVDRERERILDLVRTRLRFSGDSGVLHPQFGPIELLEDRQALRLPLSFASAGRLGVLRIEAALFPYDSNHQTFVNIYENGRITQQFIFDRSHNFLEHFTGTRQGIAGAIRKFAVAGVHHILIGPDHILFIVGLLLLGGAFLQHLKIVTAFTAAHSVTLTLAALGWLQPPARIIEPGIALSIMYVGMDNILVAREGRDVRAFIAFFFGLLHGFGFANVLQELGLPGQALGWSLFSFNLGVEIGQIAIVVLVVTVLSLVRKRSERLARQVATAGSVAVILVGFWWFLERVFFQL